MKYTWLDFDEGSCIPTFILPKIDNYRGKIALKENSKNST
jgi:hypothetical protein